MKLKYQIIDNKKDLVDYKSEILNLFRVCFDKDLNESIWEWAYIDNPLGKPIVSLCMNNKNEVVGHYAIIPYSINYKGEEINTYLSMTTMVNKSYRRHGIFVEQAQSVYEHAKMQGVELIIGFPNKMSLPGFKKRLDWKFDKPSYVASVTKKQLMSNDMFQKLLTNNELISVDKDSKKFLNWRLSKPTQTYQEKNNIILKSYNNSEDIVYIDENFKGEIADNKKYNILIDGSIEELQKFKVFDYFFGYKNLNYDLDNLKFKKDMLLSDVF